VEQAAEYIRLETCHQFQNQVRWRFWEPAFWVLPRIAGVTGRVNELTITVTEFYSDGSTKKFTLTHMISNNSESTYYVGSYRVFVDTNGNDQIRQCYIVK